MFVIKDFSKHYGDHLALNIANLRLDAGVYWIKGENGSGKTTFFKSIAGLLPCKGKIEFDDGISLHHHAIDYRKRVSYSEAEPLYPGFLTAKDLFRFVGKTKQASLAQQDELKNKFGMNSYFEKSCETYSSGMLKKLSLAMAFLGTPHLIILDEPLITLDEAARKILLNIIDQFVEQKVTFLISSHQVLEQSDFTVKATFIIQDRSIVSL